MLSSRRALAIAFCATIGAFLISTWISQVQMRSVESASQQIAHDDMPSIEHLASARLELYKLEGLIRQFIDEAAQGKPHDPAAMAQARARFHSEARAYLALPPDQGERELYEQIARQVADLDGELATIQRQVEAEQYDAAHAELDTGVQASLERSAGAVLQLMAFDANLAAQRADHIEQTRRTTMHLTIALTALAAVLGLGAGFIVWRTVAANEDLLSLHNRTLQERATELEAFASRVAHDVLSPLAGVGLAFDGIARHAHGEVPTELLTRGRSSLQRVRAVVDDLLTFARSGAQPDPNARANVGEVLRGVVEEFAPRATSAGIDLALEGGVDAQAVCSAGVLTSMASNLVQNAIKYLGERPVRRVRVRTLQANGLIRVEVEDTGPGVPPELVGKIFEPYVRATSRATGIGLGLATVRRLAQSHRGAAGVDSRLGVGSTFWFELPVVTATRRFLEQAESTWAITQH